MKNISKLKNSTESAVKCGSRLVACRTEDAVELVAEVDAVIAERDQLRAEVDRRARNEIRLGDLYSTTEKHLIASGIENDRLREEVEALRKDAERYRWLRKGESDDVAVVRGLGAMDYGMSAVAYTHSEEIDGDDLDAAIDAAMAAKEGE